MFGYSPTFMFLDVLFSLFVLSQQLVPTSSANWAVLIAGSNSFYNYRHQSDICHAYQILTKKGGIPESNIVVMMYDDIARNSENPFPGQMFNKPNGTNVYAGVKIDYKGNAVNKTTFLKVLQGDETAGGKVLKSTGQDDVFIYYSDHGATGLVAMPVGDYLYADELLKALTFMHENKMYRQLVFYLEACESGSMFSGGKLPKDLNIFATTAANPYESSYAFYYWQPVGTYLGDEYSIRWMEDSDRNWNKHESLLTQFAHVKTQVKESHPQEYGTLSFVSEPISDFQGNDSPRNKKASTSSGNDTLVPFTSEQNGWSISSRDVKLFYLMQRYQSASSVSGKKAARLLMEQEIEYRSTVQRQIRQLVETAMELGRYYLKSGDSEVDAFMKEYRTPRDFDCLRRSVDAFTKMCSPLTDYGLKYVQNLVQVCETFGQGIGMDAIHVTCTGE